MIVKSKNGTRKGKAEMVMEQEKLRKGGAYSLTKNATKKNKSDKVRHDSEGQLWWHTWSGSG